MVQHNNEQFRAYLSRRRLLQGVAGLLVSLSLEGCTQPLSSNTHVSASPTARPRGSVLYSYRGHKDRVTSIAWSPDGKYIASGSLDKTVQVWGTNSNEHAPAFTYNGHLAGVQSVDWSAQGTRIASGSIDTTVQMWDAHTGEHRNILHGHTDVVLTVAWSPDGHSLASGSADGTLRLWDAMTGKQRFVYRGHTASVNALVWSPDSQHVASGASDKTVQIIDASSGKQVFVYHGHTNTVTSVAWSPDGAYIASGSLDKTLQTWHAFTGVRLYTYQGYNVQVARTDTSKGVLPDIILDVAWSHRGKRLAAVTQVYCGDSCGVLLEWDAYTEQHLNFSVDDPIFAIAWSPDDTRLASSIVATTQGDAAAKADGPYVQIMQA